MIMRRQNEVKKCRKLGQKVLKNQSKIDMKIEPEKVSKKCQKIVTLKVPNPILAAVLLVNPEDARR